MAVSILSGIQRRLLVMLLIPLAGLALVSAGFDYRSAGNAAVRQDQHLKALAPLLADSVVAPGRSPEEAPVLLLAPPVEEFLKGRTGYRAFLLTDLQGRPLLGDEWLGAAVPTTREAEFHSQEEGGTTYRIVAQRATTAAGELVVYLADGSDGRQQWMVSVLAKVLLPNLFLVMVAGLSVTWAVRRALRPLLALTQAVEQRSPRDLSAIDAEQSPDEVRPLVHSLNRLFALVDAQAQNQRRFVADAAHQLRTPLAGLQAQVEAWSQVVQRGSPEEKAAPAIENSTSGAILLGADQVLKLRNATRRTSQLANQLLTLSRADAPSLALQAMQPVDLKELCESVLALYLDAALANGLDLGLEAGVASVEGHAWLLRELMVNLVDNAVAYCPAGSVITLRCGIRRNDDGSGPTPFMEVEDDGPGIAPDERALVLERFYRLPGTAGEGNGLGLAIAQEIAHVHGSSLELDVGERGRGLRIGLRFHSEKP